MTISLLLSINPKSLKRNSGNIISEQTAENQTYLNKILNILNIISSSFGILEELLRFPEPLSRFTPGNSFNYFEWRKIVRKIEEIQDELDTLRRIYGKNPNGPRRW